MHPDNLSATKSIFLGSRLEPMNTKDDIPERWRGTPIEEFIGIHNFGQTVDSQATPRLLIVSCIEFRFSLNIPSGFSYVIRTPAGRLSHLPSSEFAMAYTLAKGVRHVALVGHNDCGMTKVFENAPKLIEALIEQGWETKEAKKFIESRASQFAIDDEIESLKIEFNELKEEFKKIEIAPLFASLKSNRLHYPTWYKNLAVN